MRNLKELEQNFGSVEFEGKKYILTAQADFTGRLLPGAYVNLNEAEEGEDFDFEMSASAIDKDGVEFEVYWIFTDTKGQEKELDAFDYDNADRVVITDNSLGK